MVMSRKEGPGSMGRMVQVFGHRPGDRDAVESARPATNLVQENQTSTGGMPQDMSRLFHLDHKGRFAPRQEIPSANPRKDTVYQPYAGRARRDIATHLSQNDDQGQLTHVGGL